MLVETITLSIISFIRFCLTKKERHIAVSITSVFFSLYFYYVYEPKYVQPLHESIKQYQEICKTWEHKAVEQINWLDTISNKLDTVQLYIDSNYFGMGVKQHFQVKSKTTSK